MDLKPESGWTQKALNVLVEINKRFPELSKYIEEMPILLGQSGQKSHT